MEWHVSLTSLSRKVGAGRIPPHMFVQAVNSVNSPIVGHVFDIGPQVLSLGVMSVIIVISAFNEYCLPVVPIRLAMSALKHHII